MTFTKLYDDLYVKNSLFSENSTEVKSKGWSIYLNGECVDFVWFDVEYSQKEAWDLLIYQYGYSVHIKIHKPS